MPLTSGSRLGPYEITAAIGAGGMGEVFRARDTRLGRDVAIKVLPAALAQDEERVARFRREAQVLAALNHPNIAAIYGLEESEGLVGLVMELVPGEDLAERAKRGRIPLDEATAIARQIAEALEEAHEKGIVHRDLKPANVKVTPEGKVKVLDFGLAKALGGDAASDGASDVSNSPTLSRHATEAGLILGTAAYMSPEQARGKAVDKRADIWSFGVVMFEMFSGKRLFTGETVTDVLAAVLTRDPDWSSLPPEVPAGVRMLMMRCLERDPRRRLRDVGEARLSLDPQSPASSASSLTFAAPALPAPKAPKVRRFPAALTASLLFVAWVISRRSPAGPQRPVFVYDIEPEPGASFVLSDHPVLDIAPDGSRIVYVARKDGAQHLYVRERSNALARRIPGTDGALSPALSPDGRSVAFFADNKLKVASLDGAPIVLTAVNDPRGVTWLDKEKLAFSPEAGSPLLSIPAQGGTTVPFSALKADQGERSHRWPQAIPGGGALFTVGEVSSQGAYDGSRIDAVPGALGSRRTLFTGARFARYRSGRLLFVRGATLFSTAFDLGRGTSMETPVAMADDVSGDTGTGAAHLAVSDEGTLAYVTGGVDETQRTILWVERSGTTRTLPVPPNDYGEITLSPDGSRFAVVVHGTGGRGGDIWVYHVARQLLTRFTFEGNVIAPAWSSDSQWIYYSALDPSTHKATLHRKPVTGDREAERLGSPDILFSIEQISRDGRSAFVHLRRDATIVDVDRMDLATGKSEPFLSTPFYEAGAQTSPDGRLVAYQSDETGRPEIYVKTSNGSGRFQVSQGGGEEPRWSANGRELYYREGASLMAVAVESGPQFRTNPPRRLLDGLYFARADTGMSYSVFGNGERFLMIGPSGGALAPKRIRVIVNYPATLAASSARP
ncbi:MAG: protein kinase [Vicinamibacteria bacterium]|nr:protein kinase [Vicinamibacteria bacterium]